MTILGSHPKRPSPNLPFYRGPIVMTLILLVLFLMETLDNRPFPNLPKLTRLITFFKRGGHGCALGKVLFLPE